MRVLKSACALVFIAASSAASQLPPVRPLGPVAATTTESFGGIPSIRVLSDGRVLVSDMTRRRLVLYDTTLAKPQGILNPTGAAAQTYPARGGMLLPLPGDTTLLFDAAGFSFMVLGPRADIARVIAVPRALDSYVMAFPGNGDPVIDAQRRLIYRIQMRPTGFSSASFQPIYPDTTAVVAVGFDTRRADTLAWMKIPPSVPTVSTRDPDGRFRITQIRPPFELSDDWAALSDGTVAILRWRDYHVDWRYPDGRKESAPKTAWNWVRMSDEEKGNFIDTLKAVFHKADSIQTSQMFFSGSAANAPIFESLTVAPSEVPDYPPPFVKGATKVDLQDRIWVLERAPVTGKPGGLVYDVIDRTGQIVDRVQMPVNAAIAGFGRGNSVYLSITPTNNSLAASVPIMPVPAGPTVAAKLARAILPPKP